MAVVPRKGEEGVIFVAGNVSAEKVTVGDVQAAHVEQQKVTVRETGHTVYLRNEVYTKANFYIKVSRPYITSKKLRLFKHFRWFQTIILTSMFFQIGSLAGVTGVLPTYQPDFINSLVCLVLSGATLLSLMPLLILFSQHLHVIRWTIPWVLRQPIMKDANFSNKHLEVAVTSLEGVLLSARQRGVGQVTERTGKIKLQVLGGPAVKKIKCAVATSITFTVIVLASIIWALATSAVSIVRFIDVQISETSLNTTEAIV